MNAKELSAMGRLLNQALVAAARLTKAADDLGITPQVRKRRRNKAAVPAKPKPKPKPAKPIPVAETD